MRDWSKILIACGVKAATSARWAPVFADVVGPDTFSLDGREVDDFLGQILHESDKLEALEENLNYSAERMCQIWPRRFPNVAAAAPYARNPRALANKVYGGRLGNVGPDDGWLYRGSGLIQCTGKDNFAMVGRAIGLNLVASPDLLRKDPRTALLSAIAWWEKRVPDALMGDPRAIRKVVNGGDIGLQDTIKIADRADRSDGSRDGALS